MSWERFRQWSLEIPSLDILLDFSRLRMEQEDKEALRPAIRRALGEMEALEKGGIANPDENRMVGHYWLRDAQRAPDPAIAEAIGSSIAAVEDFAGRVHGGRLKGEGGGFQHALVVGIGGSALGPQFLYRALGTTGLRLHFLDNTDPDGIGGTLRDLEGELDRTLVLVISKSGGTVETRNGMLEARAAYSRRGLDFARHAVAATGEGSRLDRLARDQGWLQRFCMWDWVGGRTSVMSAAGLLPAALHGVEVAALLEGARLMDQAGREPRLEDNPAALLAAAWHHCGGGRGDRHMVLLPYRDRLELLSRYLQQLVMESLGKDRDRRGVPVAQGIAVLGNKGSTDQHAYVQQLIDGRDDFFATFVDVLEDREGQGIEVEEGIRSGDYLSGFCSGTQEALSRKGRRSLSITLPRIDARSLGALIALFERAVGIYASMIDINAYHQPGVEAGKKAAGQVIALQREVMDFLGRNPQRGYSAEEICARLDRKGEEERVWRIGRRLAASRPGSFRRIPQEDPFGTLFQKAE